MKNLLGGARVLILNVSATPALGADYDWTGVYVGVNAGDGVNDSKYRIQTDIRDPLPGFAETNGLREENQNLNDTAFTGGAQAGYNWHVNRFVLGVELDFNYNGVDQTSIVDRPLASPLAGNVIYHASQRFDWFGTVRGRLGVTALPQWLVYATGGLAYGHVSSETTGFFTATEDRYAGSGSATLPGWTVGARSEWGISPAWSAKLEYLYVDLGTFSYTSECVNCLANGITNGPFLRTDVTTREHLVRFGLNYRFGGRSR